jgi:hypothetical protein
MDAIDPARAWEPWRPTAEDPWGPKWAAHLYRRAGFGAGREEILEAVRLGPEGTLELLLRGRPEARELDETLADVGRIAAGRDDGGTQLRGWWVYAMIRGGHPLREKMTLFWHDHFATSLAKVQDPALMFRQNGLLREHALGRFGPMLQAVSRDPAMLVWLDAATNVKGRPNENYARELMELFSLGVGHYTEKDIREAARAFTGWRADGERYAFEPRLHDGGTKTVLGQTGPWDGGDVVRIVLEQPAAARFLVRKLYRFLVAEQDGPPDPLLEPLCKTFREGEYDVAGLVRTILGSRHFYSAHAFRRRVKWPVEYVLGAVKAVYRPSSEGDPDDRAIPQQVLVDRIDAMGQALFAPPNVKGWPGGTTWINTSRMLARDNFAESLAMGTLWPRSSGEAGAGEGDSPSRTVARLVRKVTRLAAPPSAPGPPEPPRAFDPAGLLDDEGVSQPEAIVDAMLEHYLPGGVRPEARARLVAFVAEGRPAGAALRRRVREAVHAVLSMAEYHLA